jgi:CO/xanthine dehydrogenase Mo-binding subunit
VVGRFDVLGALLGRGGFVGDLAPIYRGKYGVFVRSPYAHARIKSIDVGDAVRGGALVLTGSDLRVGAVGEVGEASGVSNYLAVDKVRYVGDPVALVIADDPYKALDLAELVQVDYEPLPPVPNIDVALRNESLVFEDVGSNVVYSQTFEYGSMPTNTNVLSLDLYWSRSSGNPIEPFEAVVYPTDGGLSIISNVQGPYAAANEVSRVLGVRVMHVPTRHGGSFGSKFSLTKYLVILGYAALKFKVPIRWVETRTEHLMASGSSGPERKFHIDAYYTSGGVVRGLDIHIWEDVGASRSSGQAFKPLGILAGPYKITNLRYKADLVATNKNPPGAFRGAGTPPHTWALERVMDALADELGMDRAEVRRRNLIDSLPYEAPYDYYDSGNPKGLLEAALSRTDLFSMRSENIGVGIAVSTDPSTPEGSEGVRLSIRDGKVVVGVGFGGEGQGNEHTLILLVSKLLQIKPEEVVVEYLDNLSSPQSFGPGGSRMGVFTAGAVIGAVNALKEKLMVKAREVLGNDVVYEEGNFYSPRGSIRITEFNGEFVDYVYELKARKGRFTAYPFACDVAVVRVNDDGTVKPLKHVVYLDPGTPIDEEVVKEQVMGGTAIGISVALYEAYKYDDDGNLLTTNIADYGLPNAEDMPEIEVHLMPTPSTVTPMGVKGIGEVPVGIAAAAVVSAIEDVLRRRGLKARLTKVPVTPEDLWKILNT